MPACGYSWIPAGIALAGFLMLFALLRLLARWCIPAGVTGTDKDSLQKRFARFARFDGLLTALFGLPLMGVVTVFYFLVFWELAGHYYHQWGDTVYLKPMTPAYWVLPALFLGIVTAVSVVKPLYEIALGDRFDDYLAYGRQRQGLDAIKLFQKLAAAVVVGAAVAAYLGMDCYARATERRLVINEFCGLGERAYPYRRVRSISQDYFVYKPSEQEKIRRPFYTITFDDGYRWCTQGLVKDVGADDDALIRYVSERSGVSIQPAGGHGATVH